VTISDRWWKLSMAAQSPVIGENGPRFVFLSGHQREWISGTGYNS